MEVSRYYNNRLFSFRLYKYSFEIDTFYLVYVAGAHLFHFSKFRTKRKQKKTARKYTFSYLAGHYTVARVFYHMSNQTIPSFLWVYHLIIHFKPLCVSKLFLLLFVERNMFSLHCFYLDTGYAYIQRHLKLFGVACKFTLEPKTHFKFITFCRFIVWQRFHIAFQQLVHSKVLKNKPSIQK